MQARFLRPLKTVSREDLRMSVVAAGSVVECHEAHAEGSKLSKFCTVREIDNCSEDIRTGVTVGIARRNWTFHAEHLDRANPRNDLRAQL